MNVQNKKAIIIGCGIAGPALAIFLKRIGIACSIYEAHGAERDYAGLFLGISPNGLNVLSEILPVSKLMTEYTPAAMNFYNAKNKKIGTLDNSYQYELYGAATIQIKRGNLNKALREAAEAAGIEINFGKKLKQIKQSSNTVTAFFEDGSEVVADFLIGCDGIHSATRKSIFPKAPAMKYTGLISTGGYSTLENAAKYRDAIHMIFGKKAFFAYAISNKDEVWWFNNMAQEKEWSGNEPGRYEKEAMINTLLSLHRNDPAPIHDIIRNTQQISAYPVYDIPALPEWYQGNVCLLGDAAHATAPHIGQGASLALEDTIFLAKCIRDAATPEKAFHRFQTERKDRVEKIIQQARKIGDVKAVPNRIQRFFRDMLLGVFIKKEARKMDWVYAYKVIW